MSNSREERIIIEGEPIALLPAAGGGVLPQYCLKARSGTLASSGRALWGYAFEPSLTVGLVPRHSNTLLGQNPAGLAVPKRLCHNIKAAALVH